MVTPINYRYAPHNDDSANDGPLSIVCYIYIYIYIYICIYIANNGDT